MKNKLLLMIGMLLMFSMHSEAQLRVRVFTVMGDFDIELFTEVAPITVNNFLAYMLDGDFNNTIVHRSISDFVIQTGRHTFDGTSRIEPRDYPIVRQRDPIQNEPFRSNLRGTIAMAKQSGGLDPENSARNQFFFNLADNTDLDTQNGGFAVFGEVLGDGMAIIDAIGALPTFEFQSPFQAAPMRNYTEADFNGAVPVGLNSLVIIWGFEVLTPETLPKPPVSVIPWAVNNDNFTSRLAIFNNAESEAFVDLFAYTQDGSSTTQTIAIKGSGVFAAEAGDLFPDLNGYSIFFNSLTSDIHTSFLTFNRQEISGGNSPSQTTARRIEELSTTLIFGYVPGDQVSAIVLVATGSSEADTPVTLTLHGSEGGVLATKDINLFGNQPMALVVDTLFEGVTPPRDATIKAVSTGGTAISGTTFAFNEQRQPSMSAAFPIPVVVEEGLEGSTD